MDAILDPLLKFGLAGIFAAAILWLMWYQQTRTIPGMLKTFAKEMAAEREQCQGHHDILVAKVDALIAARK